MTDITNQSLKELGIADEIQLSLRFEDIRRSLKEDVAKAAESGDVKRLLQDWISPQDSVVSKITNNWLSGAPADLQQRISKDLANLATDVQIFSEVLEPISAFQVMSPEAVTTKFAGFKQYFDRYISNCTDQTDLGVDQVFWIGRNASVKSYLTDYWIKKAPPILKSTVGREFNKLLTYINEQFEKISVEMKAAEEEAALARERVDLSLPGVTRPVGSHHLIRQVFQEIEDIFVSIGFSVVEGPEIETPYYNFEALNIPEFHPVRDDMDTFYIELPKGAPSPLLLRTHTSPMQIRTMEKRQPPIRVIVPGKVYRRDNPDATHSFAFHQVEGLAVDTDITFCDFTGTIEYFVKQFFGPGVKTRFRPSYFPFTEPSVEFDVTCVFCGGSGVSAGGGTCSKCKGAGWIELFGAGMVDPAVYGFVGYDAKKISGFAFGIGIDRLAMLKYGIDDIQVFFQSDVRFLRQFP
jgi:phenylalanyl-tRNA synthetase alpha chain